MEDSPSIQHVESVDELANLYPLYVQYHIDITKGCGEDFPPYDFMEFMEWWQELHPADRRVSRREFQLGYAKVREEGKRATREYLEARNQGDNLTSEDLQPE